MVHLLQATQNWSFHVAVLQRMAKKYTKNYDAHEQPLFCSLNILFGDVSLPFCVKFAILILMLNVTNSACFADRLLLLMT